MIGSALFFELYDPYTWHLAYANGTPKGRNRHYPAADLSKAIAKWWNYLIVIPPPGTGGAKALKLNDGLVPVDPAGVKPAWGM